MPRRRGGDESEGGSQLAPTGGAGSLARLGTDDMVRPPDPELPELYERQPIAPAVANRLRSLTRHEARSQKPRYFKPTWSQGRSLPGLIVAQRWARDDAFGCARQIAELDAALRRGTALIELFSSGERVDTWPRPIRPERGGLRLLDAGYGSLDLLWTIYGTLVSVAATTPVSLASFASLAWNSSKYASRMAHTWVVRPLEARELVDPPSAADPPPIVAPSAENWQERTTKRLMPLLRQAVDDGRGLDFHAAGQDGELRLIVTPKAYEADAGENAF